MIPGNCARVLSPLKGSPWFWICSSTGPTGSLRRTQWLLSLTWTLKQRESKITNCFAVKSNNSNFVLLSALVPVMKFSSQYNRTLSCELGPNDVDYVDYSCHFLLSITPLCSHWIHSCFHKQSVSGCCRNITLPPYLFLTNSIRIEQSTTKYNWQIARRSTMVQMPWTFLGDWVFFCKPGYFSLPMQRKQLKTFSGVCFQTQSG